MLRFVNNYLIHSSVRLHQTTSWVMASGERYCFLTDRQTGLPEFHSLLYVTTQIRGQSLSHSAMEQACSAIAVLLHFFQSRKSRATVTTPHHLELDRKKGHNNIDPKPVGASDDLATRFLRREFLLPHECQGIRDHCQLDFGRSNGIPPAISVSLAKGGKKGYIPPRKTVSQRTESIRLTHIAQYLEWLATHLLSRSLDQKTIKAIGSMKTSLLTLRPNNKGRAAYLDEERGLSHAQERALMEIARPGAEQNPFVGRDIQVRNELIIHALHGLGLRGGELLNIRVDDLDNKRNEVLIKRRADEKTDPRKRQPLVKTRARRLPLGPELAALFRYYIVHVRRRIPNAGRYPYVFITHKSGPTQGDPMSIETYKQVIRKFSAANPLLYGFTGHDLRHTWNDRYSEHMDSKPDPESEIMQAKIREDLMGWVEDSETAKIYNKRFIRRKGRKVGLELQEKAYHEALDAKARKSKASE